MPLNKMLLEAYLKKLKMPQAAKTYESLAREAGDNNLSYEEYLLGVLEQEIHQRENNRIQRGIKQAAFPVIKTLENFDFKAIPSLNKPRVLKLMQGEYIRKKENIILVGSSGVGKTHIATALGYEACRQGLRVKFYTAAGLINELLAAQQEYRLNRLEKQWLVPHVIILDELGYVPFSKMGAELLFQFCAARYERGSIIITTNLEFPKWTEVLGDEQMTAALLDRLTHNAHILNINGDSYRFKQALAKQTETT
ncbi:MAG TPA: IS21-like element helper ATPase IstB [Sedimentibacter sp.]|nr:IS21-like element helper ATPase IstB [Sedimentibacter sp.]